MLSALDGFLLRLPPAPLARTQGWHFPLVHLFCFVVFFVLFSGFFLGKTTVFFYESKRQICSCTGTRWERTKTQRPAALEAAAAAAAGRKWSDFCWSLVWRSDWRIPGFQNSSCQLLCKLIYDACVQRKKKIAAPLSKFLSLKLIIYHDFYNYLNNIWINTTLACFAHEVHFFVILLNSNSKNKNKNAKRRIVTYLWFQSLLWKFEGKE